MEEYYAIRELEPLVQAVIDAHGKVDDALEEWEAAIGNLAEGHRVLELKRAAAAAEDDEDEDA
jgi:hypothetical protein